jgi:hypothetical protein
MKQRTRTFGEFFDAFSSSAATQEAIKDGTISSDTLRHLNTYVKKAYAPKHAPKEPPSLPPPYDMLIPLQDRTGKWCDLPRVLAVLDLPPDTRLGRGLEDWEEGTVFAVAAIRQRPELFSSLGDAHDRGLQWISSRGLITMALEILGDYREPDYRKAYKQSVDRLVVSKDRVVEMEDLESATLERGSLSASSSMVHRGADGEDDSSVFGRGKRGKGGPPPPPQGGPAEAHYRELLGEQARIQVRGND